MSKIIIPNPVSPITQNITKIINKNRKIMNVTSSKELPKKEKIDYAK